MATKKTTVKKATTKRTTRAAATTKKATRKAPAKRPAGWTDKVKKNFDDATGTAAAKKTARKGKAAKKTAASAPTGAKVSSLGREGSVGHLYRKCIVEGKDKDATEKAVQKAFPDYEIKPNYYAWYKNDCRKKGLVE